MALRSALRWAGAQTVIRMAIGFVSAKITAIYLGPAGMALAGQLSNFIDVACGAIGNGANIAVVNLTGQKHAEPKDLARLWGTATRLVLTFGGLLFVVVALASTQLAQWLLLDAAYWPVVVAAGLAIAFAAADAVISGVLNGLKQIRLLSQSGILALLAGFVGYAALTYSHGLWGALFATALIYPLRFLITLSFALNSDKARLADLFARYDRSVAKEILGFYPMLLVHSIALPLSLIFVRNSVIDAMGIEQAGHLQAAWRISEIYVGVLTTALGLYFMSHFSSLGSDAQRGGMLRRTVVQMTGLTALAALAIYLARDAIITLVLTQRFLPVGDLLPLQLTGDIFKMASYPLQMALVAQRRSLAYMAQAACGPLVFAVLTNVFLFQGLTVAAPLAYLASNALMLLWMSIIQYHSLKGHS